MVAPGWEFSTLVEQLASTQASTVAMVVVAAIVEVAMGSSTQGGAIRDASVVTRTSGTSVVGGDSILQRWWGSARLFLGPVPFSFQWF